MELRFDLGISFLSSAIPIPFSTEGVWMGLGWFGLCLLAFVLSWFVGFASYYAVVVPLWLKFCSDCEKELSLCL